MQKHYFCLKKTHHRKIYCAIVAKFYFYCYPNILFCWFFVGPFSIQRDHIRITNSKFHKIYFEVYECNSIFFWNFIKAGEQFCDSQYASLDNIAHLICNLLLKERIWLDEETLSFNREETWKWQNSFPWNHTHSPLQ